MGDIVVEINDRALLEALEVLGARRGFAARARAVNKTATPVRRQVLRTLSAETGLPQKDFNRAVRIRRVRIGALGRVASGRQILIGRNPRATARITAVGRDISVHRLRPRQTRSGVTFGRGRGRRRQVQSAFLARVRGSEGVFVRAESFRAVQADAVQVRRRRRSKSGPDFPIARLVVPGVSAVMQQAALQRAIQEQGVETLQKRLVEEIRFELLRVTGRLREPRRRRSR